MTGLIGIIVLFVYVYNDVYTNIAIALPTKVMFLIIITSPGCNKFCVIPNTFHTCQCTPSNFCVDLTHGKQTTQHIRVHD